MSTVGELACSYAVMILEDEGIAITVSLNLLTFSESHVLAIVVAISCFGWILFIIETTWCECLF